GGHLPGGRQKRRCTLWRNRAAGLHSLAAALPGPIGLGAAEIRPRSRGQECAVMIDYQIQPSTRRCSVTGRELRPGERYYSVLLDEAGKFIRKDYGAEAWQGPPDGAFSFWAGRVPPPPGRRRPPIDHHRSLD